jgi:hypothetical protein
VKYLEITIIKGLYLNCPGWHEYCIGVKWFSLMGLEAHLTHSREAALRIVNFFAVIVKYTAAAVCLNLRREVKPYFFKTGPFTHFG